MAWRALTRRMIAVWRQRRQRCTAAAAPAPACPFGFHPKREQQQLGDGKPYEMIPTPKGWPVIGTVLDIMRSGGAAKIHEYCDKRHKEMGPIFRERLGAVEAVVVADENYISTVYTAEGKHPQHMIPEPWVMYNKMKGINRGVFFMDGSDWLKRRNTLTQAFLFTPEIKSYSKPFSGIVYDLLDRWDVLAEKNKDRIVPNLENELYNWSIESLGTIVFGRRLQCVTSASQESEMHEFVHYVQKIFGESAKLSIIPPKLAATLRLPVWRRFVDAADNALRIAREYTEARIAEITAEKDNSKFHGLLVQLLNQKQLTYDEIVNIVADLILAAADTTSHATQWALYLLANHPECQEKLLHHINEVVSPDEEMHYDNVENIPYSMWIIKEALRLYPIASFLTRILPKDVVLGGYKVPAGKLIIMSQYTMGRDPKQFDNPDQFNPERWYRPPSNGAHQNLSHGCIPFGSGSRFCIGRKVAELKMRLLLTNLVRKYKIHSTNQVGISLRMITTPDRPIQIRLEKRNN